jgi:hypothetical protein
MHLSRYLDQERSMNDLYFLEFHRDRIAGYERDMGRRHSTPTPANREPLRHVGTSLLRRRQPRLVTPDACRCL